MRPSSGQGQGVSSGRREMPRAGIRRRGSPASCTSRHPWASLRTGTVWGCFGLLLQPLPTSYSTLATTLRALVTLLLAIARRTKRPISWKRLACQAAHCELCSRPAGQLPPSRALGAPLVSRARHRPWRNVTMLVPRIKHLMAIHDSRPKMTTNRPGRRKPAVRTWEELLSRSWNGIPTPRGCSREAECHVFQ